MSIVNKTLNITTKGLFLSALCWTSLQANPCDYSWDAGCACPNRFWVDAEYLYWEIQGSPESVPLVFQGDSEDSLLSDPGSTVVLGGKRIDTDWRSGGRFALGTWFDNERSFGMEANYFFLPSNSTQHSVASSGLPGSPFLFIPYFDATDGGRESAFAIADSDFPVDEGGPFSGLATVKLSNKMQNAELNFLSSYSCGCALNVTWLAGFRYWNFDEELHFTVNSPFITVVDDIVDVFTFKDKFDTQNNFYGGQLGVAFDYTYDCFFANVKGKVALGANCGQVNINGDLVTNEYADVLTEYEGGFFALPTNIGKHSKSNFSVIPEVNVNLGYFVTENARIQVGYTFLYASNVLRAGKQINPLLNTTQSATVNQLPVNEDPIPAQPIAFNKTSGLWAQGISAGFEFRF